MPINKFNSFGNTTCRALPALVLYAAVASSTHASDSPSSIMRQTVPVAAPAMAQSKREKVTLTLINTEISEAVALLSRKERVNIVLSKDVSGEISVNLYDVDIDHAINILAEVAGGVVQRHGDTYYIIKREEVGKYKTSGTTLIRSYKVQYSDTEVVAKILQNYLSSFGKLTTLPGRNLLVIEDLPEFHSRVEMLLSQVDRAPKQILIEARLLEITLNDSDAYGIDWTKLFASDGGSGSFGVQGLASPSSPGLFLSVLHPNIELSINALTTQGRVRTLSSPRLLAIENQEAKVVVGDRLGYRVTTTINQVTSESIEFLESGIILNVKPSVDEQGRILMEVHPEVSTGTVNEGIPKLTTTEVTTHLLAENGQTVFIAGLIKNSVSQSRSGVPVLKDLPFLGAIFSNSNDISINTETVILMTPYIVTESNFNLTRKAIDKVEMTRKDLIKEPGRIEADFKTPPPAQTNLEGNPEQWTDDESLW